MRIAVIAEDYPPNSGGIADYAGNLVHALVAEGHDVQVVSAHVSGDAELDKTSLAPVSRVGETNVRQQSLGLLARLKAVREMSDGIERWMERVYNGDSPDFAILTSVSTWANVCIRRGIPYIVCVHGGDAFGKRSDFIRSLYRRWAVSRILSRASYVAANSGFTERQIIDSGVDQKKVIVTYCGVSAEFLQTVDRMGKEAYPEDLDGHLLMVCRLVKFKACDVVLKAVCELKEKYPRMVLTIAGDGPERQRLEKMSRELGVVGNVKFLGYVGDVAQKVELFKENEIFVLSGRFDPDAGRLETFGIVFAEAGACSRPVIGPRLGGVPEVISEAETGYLVEPDNVDSLVTAIDKVLSNSGRARSMGDAGRQRVLDKFNYARIGREIVSVMS